MNLNNKISILMPIYNEEKFIIQSLNSILRQSYENFELVIIDDFSTDNSYSICEKFAKSDSRVILRRNIDKGKVSAFNLGYSISTGNIFCSVHGDDYILEESLEKRVSLLLSHINDYAASACRIQTISEEEKFNNVIIPKNKNLGTFFGPSIMYTKKIAEKIYPIPEILPAEDKWQVLCIKTFAQNIFHISWLLFKIE